jgi:hypothetical protein
MLFHMRFPGLIKRGGVWIYRREVPPKLRAVIGKREWKEHWNERSLDSVERAKILALLARQPEANQDGQGSSDNPPLSLIFDRHQAEKTLPAKTAVEWSKARDKLSPRMEVIMCAGLVGLRAPMVSAGGRGGWHGG